MKRVFTLTVLVLLLGMISCKAEVNTSSKEMGIEIKLPGNTQRAAYYTQDDAADFVITIKKENTLVKETSGKPGQTVKVVLEEEGNYDIELKAYNEKNVLIAEGSTSSNIRFTDGIIKVKITLIPKQKPEIGFDIEVEWGNPAIPEEPEFLISEHLLETHLPEPVGVNEVLGKVFERIDPYSGTSYCIGEFIDNETFVETYLPDPDGSYLKVVNKYSYNSTKKQIYLQRSHSDHYDIDNQLTESATPESELKWASETLDSTVFLEHLYGYVGYNWGRCTVYSYIEENGKIVLKPVFPYDNLVDACYEYINFEFENESKEMSLLSYCFCINEERRMVLFDKITETTIFGKDLATNESYEIPYTIDFSKPDGEKTITIRFEGKDITFIERKMTDIERNYES